MNELQTIRRLEEIERAAWEDMVHGACRDFRARVGYEARTIGASCAIGFRPVDLPAWNRVLGLGVRGPVDESHIDETLAFYENRGTRRYSLPIAPVPEALGAARHLEQRGLRVGTRWAKLHRDRRPPIPVRTKLRIEEVDRERADDFATAVVEGFGMPDVMRGMVLPLVGRDRWRTYVAYDGDEPVAAGALYVRGALAWLGLGATRPSHRKRGAQGALASWRVADAIAMGCTAMTAETGEDTEEAPNPSMRNLLRCGFGIAYFRPNYRRPA